MRLEAARVFRGGGYIRCATYFSVPSQPSVCHKLLRASAASLCYERQIHLFPFSTVRFKVCHIFWSSFFQQVLAALVALLCFERTCFMLTATVGVRSVCNGSCSMSCVTFICYSGANSLLPLLRSHRPVGQGC